MLALVALKSFEPSVHKWDCVLKAGYICNFSVEVSSLENVAFERLGAKECSAGHIFKLARQYVHSPNSQNGHVSLQHGAL